jgi:uncharacterized protein
MRAARCGPMLGRWRQATGMTPPDDPSRHSIKGLWQEALECFAARDWWMVHELLEEVWRRRHGTQESELAQALLQAAVCLHHYGNGNFAGARLCAAQAQARLDKLPEAARGLDIARFREELRQLAAPLRQGVALRPLLPEQAPRLHARP